MGSPCNRRDNDPTRYNIVPNEIPSSGNRLHLSKFLCPKMYYRNTPSPKITLQAIINAIGYSPQLDSKTVDDTCLEASTILVCVHSNRKCCTSTTGEKQPSISHNCEP